MRSYNYYYWNNKNEIKKLFFIIDWQLISKKQNYLI